MNNVWNFFILSDTWNFSSAVSKSFKYLSFYSRTCSPKLSKTLRWRCSWKEWKKNHRIYCSKVYLNFERQYSLDNPAIFFLFWSAKLWSLSREIHKILLRKVSWEKEQLRWGELLRDYLKLSAVLQDLAHSRHQKKNIFFNYL